MSEPPRFADEADGDDAAGEAAVRIPHERLSPEALEGIIVELVTRDGTELSDLAAKLGEVRRLLQRGEVALHFDPASGTCSIVKVAEARG